MEQIHLLTKSQNSYREWCLSLTNIRNKVYSERSCLTCVLNNKETKALGYSNEK